MCGITGVFIFSQNRFNLLSKVNLSTDKLSKRGPDGGGVFIKDNCALGHRRLSIIDTSDNATQPMTDPSGRYTIIFNGEIFNFKELKQQYFPDKNDWHSQSDTEVLLELYIRKGEKCLPLLSGFFALAIYDSQKEELFIARDRYGKKPVHYYVNEDHFVFASEMKALLAYDIPKEINYTSLYQYLQLNYIPQPQSILEGVLKLPAGSYMRVKKGNVKVENWYAITPEREASTLTYPEACRELEKRLDLSVQQRMISDVPLGAFLSGGIDSSVIVALASRHTNQLNTFSIGYKDNPFFDETKYARLVADKYKTNHTVFSLGNNDFLEHIHDILGYIDEPFADSSAIPVYILSKHTRKHVTVALSGDGGDEVFAGYNKHRAEWRVRQHNLLNELVQIGGPVWKVLPQSRNNKMTNLFRQMSRFAEGAKLGAKERYWRWAAFMTEDDAWQLLHDDKKAAIDMVNYKATKQHILRHLNETEVLEDFLQTDMELVLQSDMLVKTDLMSMANSLEVRSPFLDHHVVDFAFGLPTEYKIDGKMKKKIVQDAFRDLLPAAIYNRPKQGFDVPLQEWFKNELNSFIFDDLLSEKFVREQKVFQFEEIDRLKKRLYSSNPGDTVEIIWGLIVFQSWFKNYLM